MTILGLAALTAAKWLTVGRVLTIVGTGLYTAGPYIRSFTCKKEYRR